MAKNVEYYLSVGFDRPMAEYYASGRKKLISVSANDNFTLTLTYEGGEVRLLDMSDTLVPGTVFEPFMDINNFRRVYLDDMQAIAWDIDPSVDSNTVWNNKIDICPDTAYVDSVPAGGTAHA